MTATYDGRAGLVMDLLVLQLFVYYGMAVKSVDDDNNPNYVAMEPVAETLKIGKGTSSDGSIGTFKGIIDEVAIYNRALSPEAVKNNYCAVEALVPGSDLTKNGCLK